MRNGIWQGIINTFGVLIWFSKRVAYIILQIRGWCLILDEFMVGGGMWSWLLGGGMRSWLSSVESKSGVMMFWLEEIRTDVTWPSGMDWTNVTWSSDNIGLMVSGWSVGVGLLGFGGK